MSQEKTSINEVNVNNFFTEEKIATLTPLEKNLWEMISPQYLTLGLYGEVGEAKSATLRSIADKLGMKYIRMDLATKDESDLGELPYKSVSEKTGLPFVQKVLPHWAVQAIESEIPVLVVFEEPNRCNLYTRAAALGILNERMIAGEVLPKHVFMAGAMNLGENYESETESLGLAMNNRIIWKKFALSVDEWFEYFGAKNLHPLVYSFLETNPIHAKISSKSLKGDELAFHTYRTWTGLSEYIKQFDNIGTILEKVTLNGECYVGAVALEFKTYLETIQKISYKDILNDYDKHAKELNGMSKSQHLSYLRMFENKDVAEFDLNNLTDEQYDNLEKYLLNHHDTDVIIAFIKESTMTATKNSGHKPGGDVTKIRYVQKFIQSRKRITDLKNSMRDIVKKNIAYSVS